ncbi:putative ornithine cyclodeaminase, mu-crystallin [Halovivax ruber XH-70]|uniref:Putative ornithine cyclodeaminase, mu-crystallin n=1 Tax=Halovivax ruber (strain DSM 18193 / JCM 13892 / XH-70) TaxID=797302 RepID=L0I657_HALRX|nr:ornithine cyclodeaminase family protein [Halovivax ruber]AGB15020.1 putative ornithine cyclodeaminase, mu-crystallin [Halovivax ruber XH-70]
MVLVLTEAEVESCLDLSTLVDVVGDALGKQAAGEVERPDRPHFPVGTGLAGDDPTGTAIAMPAYVHGDDLYATKLVGVHEGNADRGLPTVHAQIVLTDARTGVPTAFVGGTTVTNARTGCIGGFAVRELAPGARTLGVVGAGAQARWQTRAIDTVTALDDVRIYSPSESRLSCAADLADEGIPARAVDDAAAAVDGADVVVTATTATEPVFPADALAPGALVVAVGAFTPEMQELAPAVLDAAGTVFADVPTEVADTGDIRESTLGADDLVPLGELARDEQARASDGDAQGQAEHWRTTVDARDTPVVVDSVGSAVLDAATAITVYQRATDREIGTAFSL